MTTPIAMLGIVAALLTAVPQTGTVFTTEGGRIKGTVLEAGPAGVTVQLVDGSTRKLEAAKVGRIDFADGTSWTPTPAAPAAPAAVGAAAPAPAAPAATAAAPAAAAAAPAATAPAPAAAAPAPGAAGLVGATAPAASAVLPVSSVDPGGKVQPSTPGAPIVIPIDKLDVVYLANGGRVRALVMEEVPGQPIVVRLVDGTERRVPREKIAKIEYANGALSTITPGK